MPGKNFGWNPGIFCWMDFFGNAGKLWKLVGYGSAGRKFQPHWKKLPCQFIPFSSSTKLQGSQTTTSNYPRIVPQAARKFNSYSNLLSSIFLYVKVTKLQADFCAYCYPAFDKNKIANIPIFSKKHPPLLTSFPPCRNLVRLSQNYPTPFTWG